MVADGLEKAPALCSSLTYLPKKKSSSLTAASLGLVTSENEKDHSNTLVGCSQVDVDPEQPNAASGDQAVENKTLKEAFREADELLNSIPSHADWPGHALDFGCNSWLLFPLLLLIEDERKVQLKRPLISRADVFNCSHLSWMHGCSSAGCCVVLLKNGQLIGVEAAFSVLQWPY
ncbi:hypothetical protein Nepgr_031346 [Nepenthes gracilis]|uniref:Uncharacterized protein n=1 Tax=Nepenthes gracilis TaxID=150966 RepID=A0AAD3Y528_NEPGR|nr:hypothetical protein Nepgr_031346 [Nepenthes gracilis]